MQSLDTYTHSDTHLGKLLNNFGIITNYMYNITYPTIGSSQNGNC